MAFPRYEFNSSTMALSLFNVGAYVDVDAEERVGKRNSDGGKAFVKSVVKSGDTINHPRYG